MIHASSIVAVMTAVRGSKQNSASFRSAVVSNFPQVDAEYSKTAEFLERL